MASVKYQQRVAREKAGLCKPRENLGFPYAVTPKHFAREALAACKTQLGKDITDHTTDRFGKNVKSEDDLGWKNILGERMIRMGRKGTPGSICRRIWSIEKGDGRMNKAELVESMVIASGLIYGLDVTVPELPGNKGVAQEFATVYAEEVNPDVDVKKLADELYEFANACWQNWPEDCDHVPDDEVLKVNDLEFLAQIKELVKWPTSS